MTALEMDTLREYFGHRTPTLQQLQGESAVLVPLVEKGGAWHLLYEVRSSTIRQGGEVCFPGGHREAGETIVECALRETREELGIDPAHVEVLGQLDYLYIRGDRLLYPVLGRLDGEALTEMRPSCAEVADTFLVPLAWLRDNPPAVYRNVQPMELPGFPAEEVGIGPDYPWRPHYTEVPVYRGLPYPLWGLTARITWWLIETLKQQKAAL